MGVCCSCFGRRSEDPETSRLLSDDPYRSQYGSQGYQQRLASQPDPESVRREREALENICHSMSNNVIDVFTILPQSTSQEKDSTAQRTQTNGSSDRVHSTGDLIAVKKGRGGPVVSTLGNDINRWKAVKDAIG